MPKTDIDVKLFVVPGEKDLIKALDEIGVDYGLEPFDVGDIYIRSRTNKKDDYSNVEAIIERKAKTDLSASMSDTRYKEQKSRMYEITQDKDNVYFLIENLKIRKAKNSNKSKNFLSKKSKSKSSKKNMSGFDSDDDESSCDSDNNDANKSQGYLDSLMEDSKDHKRVWSAITNMQVRDRFRVFQTTSARQSAQWLRSLLNSYAKYGRMTTEEAREECKLKVVDTQIKKKKVAPEDFMRHSLMLIKGLQEAIADAVVAEYPTFRALSAAYVECINSDKDPAKLLKDIKRTSGNMKIGPKMSEKIWEFWQPQIEE